MKRTTYCVRNHETGAIEGSGLTRKDAEELTKSLTKKYHSKAIKMYPEEYRVIDMFTGEELGFLNQFDAEREAENRLSLHLSGYNLRRNYISPNSNAVLKVEGNDYIICSR